jgi:hypothetical protein
MSVFLITSSFVAAVLIPPTWTVTAGSGGMRETLPSFESLTQDFESLTQEAVSQEHLPKVRTSPGQQTVACGCLRRGFPPRVRALLRQVALRALQSVACRCGTFPSS